MRVKIPLDVTVRGFVNIERPNSSKELEEAVSEHLRTRGIDELNTSMLLNVEIDWTLLLTKGE